MKFTFKFKNSSNPHPYYSWATQYLLCVCTTLCAWHSFRLILVIVVWDRFCSSWFTEETAAQRDWDNLIIQVQNSSMGRIQKINCQAHWNWEDLMQNQDKGSHLPFAILFLFSLLASNDYSWNTTVNQLTLTLTQSFFPWSSSYLAAPGSHPQTTGSSGDSPAVDYDTPPVLLLGHDSRKQRVKEVTPATGVQRLKPQKYILCINKSPLSSPISHLPYLRNWLSSPEQSQGI